jgi:cysteinyl-tRNA synthetase
MYVCGPTVYGEPHIGHGRMSLAFDVLRRFLEFRGSRVHYVSNITDIDDKIIARAQSEGRTQADVAAHYEDAWWEAMDGLGVKRPTDAPHATEYVDDMVRAIAELERRGAAYETPDGVYLAVDQVPGYGLLALQPLASLRAGARVEVDEHKRSPLDFVLWKKAKPGEPTWSSPWGPGRPGWHTECVVMSLDLLGEGFDVHGGGMDLAFPHHENERAQAVALGREFARHWSHNGFLTMGGDKMSKSVGNVTSLADLVSAGQGRAYRLLLLNAHYRSPVEVSAATLAQAAAGLERFDAMGRRFRLLGGPTDVDAAASGAAGADQDAVARFCERMDDDLDTPAAMAGLFELVTEANAAADAGDEERGRRLAVTVQVLCGAVGLELAGESELGARERELVAARDEARATRDWLRADAIRDELSAAGWTVEDSPQGTRLHR